MLFRIKTLKGIADGSINVAYRRWRRPYVKVGGTLKTAVGLLHFDAIERVNFEGITNEEAIEAGHDNLADLHQELEKRDGNVFKIRFRLVGPDPRIELRNRETVSAEEWADLEKRLGRMDKASKIGRWTRKTLELIASHKGVRAADLAPEFSLERDRFKLNVRKLKNLGLTESLGTGYRISPRGKAVLKRIRAASANE